MSRIFSVPRVRAWLHWTAVMTPLVSWAGLRVQPTRAA